MKQPKSASTVLEINKKTCKSSESQIMNSIKVLQK